MQEALVLNDRPFDISDRRLVLQQVALHMHEEEIMKSTPGRCARCCMSNCAKPSPMHAMSMPR